MNLRKHARAVVLALAALPGLPALAQDFMDPAFTKTALDAVKPGWVAIREGEGQDWVYFTPLESWRCGLQSVHYGINGAPPTTEWVLEPCHSEFAQPNVSTDPARKNHINAAPGSVEELVIRLVYKDGVLDEQRILRKQVLMP